MTRYSVKEYSEYCGQKSWSVWDSKRQDYVRDHCQLVSFTLHKNIMAQLASLLNVAGKMGK